MGAKSDLSILYIWNCVWLGTIIIGNVVVKVLLINVKIVCGPLYAGLICHVVCVYVALKLKKSWD